MGDLALKVRRHTLKAADRYRLSRAISIDAIHASTPTRRFAGAVAGAAENCREDVRFPIDDIGVGVLALGDQADVFGNVGMGRTRPLAIDDFMEVRRITNISGFHYRAINLRGPEQPLIIVAIRSAGWDEIMLRLTKYYEG